MVGLRSLARLAPLAALLLAGCTSAATLRGARPLEPGQRALQGGLSLQYGSTAVSGATALWMPQVDLGLRRGISPDLDVGARVFLVGIGGDLRYRFARAGPWHFAVDPGVALGGLPVPTVTIANLDLDLPVLAEVELGPRSSLTLAGRALARENVVWLSAEGLGSGVSGRYELLAGGGLRGTRAFGRLGVGVFADGLIHTTRGGPPWLTGGVDLTLLRRPRPEPAPAP